MKRWLGWGLLIFIGTAGWRIGGTLSPDALSMATGVLFGVMAGVPTALLVMAGSRRAESKERAREARADEARWQQQGQPYSQVYGHGAGWAMPYAQQPPIIVMTGPQGMAGHQPQMQAQNQSAGDWFPHEAPTRHFTVIGEREALGEEW